MNKNFIIKILSREIIERTNPSVVLSFKGNSYIIAAAYAAFVILDGSKSSTT